MQTSTPHGRVAIIIALALAGSGLAALGAAPAIASHVSCGDTITTDTTLNNDLTDCPGDGLVIGADNITLDLRGHTIDGTVTQLSDCDVGRPTGAVGINDSAGYDGLTIKHGTLQQFAFGFIAGSGTAGMANSRLLDLTARDNRFGGISMGSGQRLNNDNRILRNDAYGNGCGAGIFLNNAHGNLVAGNQAHDNDGGIGVCCSDSNVVENNAVFDNKGGGIGVFFGSDSHNVIRHNRVSGNDIGILVSHQEGEQRDVVDANAVSGNAGAGILLDDANANQVTANRVARNGDGIVIFGDRNRIAGNDVAGAVGCPDGCGSGLSLEGGQANVIVHNAVAHTLLDGIRVTAFEKDVPTTDSVVRENVVRNAGTDGLSVGTAGEGTVTGTLLERNLALGSGDDGIDVESPDTTLTRNLALHNADLGIEAVPGVTDGGRNRAHGNGNRRQCSVVITCSM